MFLPSLLISAMMIASSPVSETILPLEYPACEMVVGAQNVVFRSTQKLRSRDGREIYFYSSGKCEGYYGDRCEFSTTYRIQDNEVRLLDERGNTLYKGSLTWKVKGQKLHSVTLAGTTYIAF